MSKCSKCGAEVKDSAFCFNCGEKVVNDTITFCQKCNAKNNINSEFCSNCGFKLNSSKSDWDKRRDEIAQRYDKLAKEFGIVDEDYFVTTVVRFNKLEKDNSKTTAVLNGVSKLNSLKKHASKLSPALEVESKLLSNPVVDRVLNPISTGDPGVDQLIHTRGNKTTIDGFFIIKDRKFVFIEIDNRDFEKTNAGIDNVYLDRTLYFDNIVSIRVTKRLGDESRYEDITKVMWTSPHDIKQSIKNDIQHLKAMRFKDLIANNDSRDMFDRLIIKLVDNTSYEIRLPSYEFGQKLVDLFESLKDQPQNIIVENQHQTSSKSQKLKEYYELLESGALTQEEFNIIKNNLLNN